MEAATDSEQQDSFQHERRNLWTLAVQNIILRVGWVFKTETVIMPYVVDALSGAGWIRGCLPILARVGQSIPPLLYAERLRCLPLKKGALFLTAIAMALPFLFLSLIWTTLPDRRVFWMPPLFLLLYFLFFSATGLNQLVFGTLQGKLIRPQRRGRLLGISGILGSVLAVSSAFLLLKPWLAIPNYDGFCWIFLFNGVAFLLAGVVALLCWEQRGPTVEMPPLKLRAPFVATWQIWRHHREFRKVARAAMLFTSSMLLFPHYQWLGIRHVGCDAGDLIYWVIAQNISVGIYSPLLGRIADQWGNRLAIRCGMFVVCLTPLLAIAFARDWVPHPERWYWLTFVLLGMTPVLMRTFLNYALELVSAEQHPQYLSTMNLTFALPFVFAPLFGSLMDLVPYEVPFLFVSGLVLLGGLQTWRMVEPRQPPVS